MSAYSGEISVGVIGAGGMGARHADNLSTRVMGARVTGVTDVDRPRAEEQAARCGLGTAVFESEQALIQDDAIDAIVIASPDDTHADLVLECLRNEKPVLCKKPLATSAEDARSIVDAEAELGTKLVQVGFMRHYDPQHLDVKSVVGSGAVGSPVLFKGTHRNLAAAPGASSESILFNSAVHDLDCARWMLGQEIEEVYVSGTDTRGNQDEDILYLRMIHLRLRNGCLASIEVYVDAAYGYEMEVEVRRRRRHRVHTHSAFQRSYGAQSETRGAPRRGRLARKVSKGLHPRVAGLDRFASRRDDHGTGRLGWVHGARGGGSLRAIRPCGRTPAYRTVVEARLIRTI
jgi:myo-inositol 2-dehydrogenase / D-chiro-inositol 1-dehydrogenase